MRLRDISDDRLWRGLGFEVALEKVCSRHPY